MELVEELDGLPLALTTAGAYLEQAATNFSEYLRLYKESWSKLLFTSVHIDSYQHRSLYTTWQITLDRIKAQNPAAAGLMKLWAYLDRQDIWYGLLQHGRSQGKAGSSEGWFQTLIEDEVSFTNAIRLLCSYGLVTPIPTIQYSTRSNGYSVHSCVHSWTVSVLNKNWDNDLAMLALVCVAEAVPEEFMDKSWLLDRRLLQHATVLAQMIESDKFNIAETYFIEDRLCGLLIREERLAEAENIHVRILQLYESTFGHEHPVTIESIFNLAVVYQRQEKLTKAEEMYNRALKLTESVPCLEGDIVVQMVHNLGCIYRRQGKLAEAEQKLILVLEIREHDLGREHFLTIQIVDDLAVLYAMQGALVEAGDMYNRALNGYERLLPPEHIAILSTVKSLGKVYHKQGRLVEAEELYDRARNGFESAHGQEHPSTLDIMEELGYLYGEQGNPSKAEEVCKQGLAACESALGREHVQTLNFVNALGSLYLNQGKLAEAEEMYGQALSGYERLLGSNHTSTVNTVYCLGLLYSRTGRVDEARAMYTQALTGCRLALLKPTRIYLDLEERCREIEASLQALESTPNETG